MSSQLNQLLAKIAKQYNKTLYFKEENGKIGVRAEENYDWFIYPHTEEKLLEILKFGIIN